MAFNNKDSDEANLLIEMIVHNLFLEHTNQFPDWRVVQIQERVIEWEVNKAVSLQDL